MLSTPAMGANHLDTLPYFVLHQPQSSSDTVTFPSADPSLILTPDASATYRQRMAPEWSSGQSNRRGPRSMNSHSVPSEPSYVPPMSESYASSEICYSPLSTLISPSSVSATNPQSYFNSYDDPTSQSMTTSSGAADPFFDAHQSYLADSTLSGVRNDSFLGQPYGSFDAADSLYDASSDFYGGYRSTNIVSSLPSHHRAASLDI